MEARTKCRFFFEISATLRKKFEIISQRNHRTIIPLNAIVNRTENGFHLKSASSVANSEGESILSTFPDGPGSQKKEPSMKEN